MFDDVDILVDLQTGAISAVIPGVTTDDGYPIALETVTAGDEFAPQE